MPTMLLKEQLRKGGCMKPRDILETLINLLADQEEVQITYIKEKQDD
jgi:hypothetical protein